MKSETPAQDVRNALAILEMTHRCAGLHGPVTISLEDYNAACLRLWEAIRKLENLTASGTFRPDPLPNTDHA